MPVRTPFEEREPIWIVLSDLYLDTELQEYDFRHIARVIRNSPYSLSEVKEIDRREVFPILYQNMLSVAGVWGGFDEEWLVTTIAKRKKRQTWFSSFFHGILYKMMKGMFKDYWEKIEKAMVEEVGQ